VTALRGKIGIDARYLEGNVSGIGHYVLNLLRGIDSANSEFRIVVLVPPGIGLPESLARSKVLDFVEVPGNPRTLREQLLLPGQVRHLGLKLLHSLDAFAPLAAKCLTLVTVHDLIPLTCRKMLHSSKKSRFAWLWRNWLALQCRRATGVLTISQYSAGEIVKWLKVPSEKVHIVEPPIEPADTVHQETIRAIRERLSLRGAFLLYVGRRDPYKNITGLIEAFAKVRTCYPGPLQLVIVGRTDPRYLEPEEAVRQAGLEGSVVFTGYLDDKEVKALYKLANAFVFPSLCEGFGMPPLEAMGYGTPVVASDRAAIPEAVGGAAILVDAANPNKLAEAIISVLTDPDLAATLRQKGPRRAAEFSFHRQGTRILKVYERLLAEAR
jgi:glycosyltransferase involved in cell wall biosynthesis